jgi:oxygen-dependent protoporphyrinogen oxidase
MHQDLILGAGISGLTLAFELAERGRDVVVLDAAPRAGGKIATKLLDGMLIEQGPQSLQATPEVLSLLGRLGLRDDIVAAHPQTSSRFVLHEGQLIELPHSLPDLFRSPLLTTREALRALAEPFVPRRVVPGETVHAFISRRLGTAIADVLIDPFVAGVFGGDPRQLEVASAFADLAGFEREHGSIVRGGLHRARTRHMPSWKPRTMFTLAGGMERLIDALAMRLGTRLHLKQRALEISRVGNTWEVRTPRQTYTARRLWICLPYRATRGLLPGLNVQIATAPITAVHLGYPREQVRHPMNGFGWLAPSYERDDVLGCLWVSSIFPGHAPGMAMLRVMIGGTRAPHLATQSPQALVQAARRIVREVQGIDVEPAFSDVSIAAEGIPQYAPGHAAAIHNLQRRWPGLRFSSWAYTGVGVSHCVRSATEHAQDVA